MSVKKKKHYRKQQQIFDEDSRPNSLPKMHIFKGQSCVRRLLAMPLLCSTATYHLQHMWTLRALPTWKL